MSVSVRQWGFGPDNTPVDFFTLANESGVVLHVSSYGACLTGLEVPARSGSVDVILGFDTLEGYMADSAYFGSTIGRTANRISGASFELNGRLHKLDSNEGSNCLHGGYSGFSNRFWSAKPFDKNGNAITLSYNSPEFEGGYPGNLQAEAIFMLLENGIRLTHRAITDSPCPVSMTSHPYFNLNGSGNNLSGHELTIFSNKILSVDKWMIPDGETMDVRRTPADFTSFAPIDGGLHSSPATHDRFYLLENKGKMSPAARVRCMKSGLEMEISTTQPGIQFYSGDGIPPDTEGKNRSFYGPRSGFCLEPHGYPDAPNRKKFPSVILNPGEIYTHSTEYRFRQI